MFYFYAGVVSYRKNYIQKNKNKNKSSSGFKLLYINEIHD